jgi:hypothetical protein
VEGFLTGVGVLTAAEDIGALTDKQRQIQNALIDSTKRAVISLWLLQDSVLS